MWKEGLTIIPFLVLDIMLVSMSSVLKFDVCMYHLSAAGNRIRTPRAFVVSAGSEHERFTNIFPFWEVNKTVQELNCKVHTDGSTTAISC